MTNEERELISQFIARVGGAQSGGFSRAVTPQTALPPIDPEADRFIADQFASHPEARYRVTQMAVVQEAALAEAANRIRQLQQLVQAAQQQQQPAQPQSRGFFGGLFGGGQQQQPQPQSPWNQGAPQQPQYAPAPPMQYPPNMSPGMLGRGGSGFLGSALTTAAGVAGGMVAGNALMDLFSGHGGGMGGMGGGFGGGFGGGMPNETTVINNYGDAGGGGGLLDNSTQGDSGWDSGGGQDSGGGGFDGGGGGFDGGGGGGGFDDNSL